MTNKIKRTLAAALAAITMATVMVSNASAIELNGSDNTVEPNAIGDSMTDTIRYTYAELYGLNTPYIGAYAYARSKTTNLTNVTRRVTSATSILDRNNVVLNSASQAANKGLNGFVQSAVSYSEQLDRVQKSKHYYDLYGSTVVSSGVFVSGSFVLDFMAN